MVVPTEWSSRCWSRRYDWESADFLSAMHKMPFALRNSSTATTSTRSYRTESRRPRVAEISGGEKRGSLFSLARHARAI
jgi:hypothetical protein